MALCATDCLYEGGACHPLLYAVKGCPLLKSSDDFHREPEDRAPFRFTETE